MPMVAKQAPYTLFVVDDDDARNPREENDNFGTMVCFHKRYNLGDERKYSEPDDFLRSLVQDSVSPQDIIDYAKSGKSDTLRFEYNKSTKEWAVSEYNEYFKKWYTEAVFEAPLKGREADVSEAVINCMRDKELLEIAEKSVIITPVFMYDHSGITINTAGFSCPWDSGQLGWIYVSHEDVKKEYGAVTPETLSRAENLLQSEVEEYDLYLTGQCYGFKLYEGHNEIDSCWGFLSSFSDIGKQIKEYLPSECRDMVDSLEYQPDRIDEDEYIENENEDEDECEL